jgi:hypothetical protein
MMYLLTFFMSFSFRVRRFLTEECRSNTTLLNKDQAVLWGEKLTLSLTLKVLQVKVVQKELFVQPHAFIEESWGSTTPHVGLSIPKSPFKTA